MENFKKYIVLWLSQSVSQLGSSMTAFALILWTYRQTHSALSVSIMSFCNYVPYILVSIFAAALFSVGGLPLILLFDLFSFAAAVCVLLFLIHIPEQITKEKFNSPFAEILVGFRFLKNEKGILYIMLTMAVLNFFSRLTYENILSPMILARSSENNFVLGFVNVCMGAGGIVGGLLVSVKKESKEKVKMIYISAALSFLFGDLTMAVSRNVFCWSFAALAASLPLPFIMAGQNLILYKKIPERIQGRVFAVRNAIQYSTIPLGILLGGYLADYVFEPFMQSNAGIVVSLGKIVGTGAGSGMAVMFLCTGICGFSMSMASLFCKEIQKLNDC